MVLCNLPSNSEWTQLDMELRYIRGSTADRCPLDVDLVDAGSGLPGQVRERSGGRAVDHAPVEGKLRPVARAHEMLLAVFDCVRESQDWAGIRYPSMLCLIAIHPSDTSTVRIS